MPLLAHWVFMQQYGSYEQVTQNYQYYLSEATQREDEWGAAWILLCMGYFALHIAGKYEEAQSLLQESLSRFRALGDQWGASWQISGLGMVAQALDNYVDAQRYHLEHLTLCKEVGDVEGISMASVELGIVAYALGEGEISRQYIGQALRVSLETRYTPTIHEVLYWVAVDLMESGAQLERAVELFTLVLNQPQIFIQRISDMCLRLDVLKDQLPAEVFAAAVQRGEVSDLIAVAIALQAQFDEPDNQNNTTAADTATDHPLTERELEILCLIADGLSNREIADKLVLAVSTVKWYINEIFSKLNVTSRAGAIDRARTLRLLA